MFDVDETREGHDTASLDLVKSTGKRAISDFSSQENDEVATERRQEKSYQSLLSRLFRPLP